MSIPMLIVWNHWPIIQYEKFPLKLSVTDFIAVACHCRTFFFFFFRSPIPSSVYLIVSDHKSKLKNEINLFENSIRQDPFQIFISM